MFLQGMSFTSQPIIMILYSIIETQALNASAAVIVRPEHNTAYLIVLLTLGAFHAFLSVWMFLEYFGLQKPYFKFKIIWIQEEL